MAWPLVCFGMVKRFRLLKSALPLLSTVALLIQNQEPLRASIAVATGMVVFAAWLGSRNDA